MDNQMKNNQISKQQLKIPKQYNQITDEVLISAYLQSEVNEVFYCQPCFKRGISSQPSCYVNLNQFDKNRYICDKCSFGQNLIISLTQSKYIYLYLIDRQNTILYKNKSKIPQNKLKNGDKLQQPINGKQKGQQQVFKQFSNNVKVNFRNKHKYKNQDYDRFISKLKQQYKNALQSIDKYQEMVNSYVQRWKRLLKIQFQSVIQTFYDQVIPQFFDQLSKLQTLKQKLMNLSLIIQTQFVTYDDNNCSLLKSKQKTIQMYEKLYKQFQQQSQKVKIYVQMFQMSGTRNLSNLQSLYNCSKGFSQAIQLLINLQFKQTNRRFDFISDKLKICSIDTLYDAEMINLGLLDNKIQKPPLFEIQKQKQIETNQMERQNIFRNQITKIKQKLATNCYNNSAQITSIKLNKNQVKLANQNVKTAEINNEKKQQKIQEKNQNLEKLRYHLIKNKKPFQSALLNQNKINRDQSILIRKSFVQKNHQANVNNLIEVENQTQSEQSQANHKEKPLPFASMKEYFSFDKNRNIFQSNISLTEQNYSQFPPPDLYLPSVESLTLKYCPQTSCQPWQILQSMKCFKKLQQLIIIQPRFATKNMIIMIAEYFPKLKSLIIKCKNEFDWEIGELFKTKMTNLTRFQVKDQKQ